jgi:hypothetical protein
LTRALYGRRVRQPLGGEFGFSRRLNELYLSSEVWNEAVANLGIDIWMTTLAINHSVPVSQAYLGRPKIQRSQDPGTSLGVLFKQVVETIFTIMERYESTWLNVKWSKPTAVWGAGLGEERNFPPVAVEIDKQALYNRFQEGSESYSEVWRRIFPRSVLNRLYEIKDANRSRLDFPVSLWARMLFDMAVGFRDRVVERNLILDSLFPLYCGKVFSFLQKTDRMSVRQVEELIEKECLVFEELRPYLNKRWKGE